MSVIQNLFIIIIIFPMCSLEVKSLWENNKSVPTPKYLLNVLASYYYSLQY